MDEVKILEKIAEVDGVYNCAVVDTKDLVFRPEFRSLCEEDTCGNYDVNYSCPPYCTRSAPLRRNSSSGLS